jgi:hypothetical protein
MMKLVHDLAQRRPLVAAMLNFGVLLLHPYILLGKKSSTLGWEKHVARIKGMRIIIENPKR